MPPEPPTFVSRAGEKLNAALDAFGLDVRGAVCADFGCNVGGFTDCLLRRGAERVLAVDTGYGQLAWRLRNDPRVGVMERTNALYCPVPQPVDLAAIDAGWTTQELIVPAALRWLRPAGAAGRSGRIVSLLKPHYELARRLGRPPHRIISGPEARQVVSEVCAGLEAAGAAVLAVAPSVLLGKGGNEEFCLLITPR
ncbi:MAG TPA: SAM-dependent methyltransferase [Phycisphaerae bacterium]|nr:SAM-dependent methyltransferase [Phycisphaerae bacterium]